MVKQVIMACALALPAHSWHEFKYLEMMVERLAKPPHVLEIEWFGKIIYRKPMLESA